MAEDLPDEKKILLAICDPGSFTKRGDYDGEPYGESIQHWSMRAVQQVIDEWLGGRMVAELPQPDADGYHDHSDSLVYGYYSQGKGGAYVHADCNWMGEIDAPAATARRVALAMLASADHADRLASDGESNGD